MPFTFSHPAIVLPLNRLSKRWFSLTALVVGSMAPDFEYFIRMRIEAKYSHSWSGLLWFDLPLGILLLFIYNSLVKNKLIDHLPPYLNKRFSSLKNVAKSHFNYHWLVIIISILIGGASHIIWDSFTHADRFFIIPIPILTYSFKIGHHHLPIFKILQHLSSLVGAAVIMFAIRQLPVGNLTSRGNIIYYWLKITSIAISVLIIKFLTGLSLHEYGDIIVSAISGALIGLIIISVITSANALEQA